MKTQVEFRSAKFPPCEGEEEHINPGLDVTPDFKHRRINGTAVLRVV